MKGLPFILFYYPIVNISYYLKGYILYFTRKYDEAIFIKKRGKAEK